MSSTEEIKNELPLSLGHSCEFFRNVQIWQCWHLCTTSNGNKLVLVTSWINFDANLHLMWYFGSKCMTNSCSGGSKGDARPSPYPPTDQNFLNFTQFFGKSGKFVIIRPHPGGLATGNPWSAPELCLPSFSNLSNTKMPTLPTFFITGKLILFLFRVNSTQSCERW